MTKEHFFGLTLLIISMSLTWIAYSQYASFQKFLGDPAIAPSGSELPAVGGVSQLTFASIATHSTRADCWIVISGKVYSVTNYLTVHPGGAGEIIPFCGKDATSAFLTQGGSGSHSSEAFQQLGAVLLGDVNSTVSEQSINNLNNALPPSIPSGRGGDDDDEEDDD